MADGVALGNIYWLGNKRFFTELILSAVFRFFDESITMKQIDSSLSLVAQNDMYVVRFKSIHSVILQSAPLLSCESKKWRRLKNLNTWHTVAK